MTAAQTTSLSRRTFRDRTRTSTSRPAQLSSCRWMHAGTSNQPLAREEQPQTAGPRPAPPRPAASSTPTFRETTAYIDHMTKSTRLAQSPGRRSVRTLIPNARDGNVKQNRPDPRAASTQDRATRRPVLCSVHTHNLSRREHEPTAHCSLSPATRHLHAGIDRK